MENADTDAVQLWHVLVAHYGAYLTAEQRLEVQHALARQAQTVQSLRAYALLNADEPLAIFSPYRAERE